MRLRKASILWLIAGIEFLIIAGGFIYASTSNVNVFAERKSSVLVIDIYGELISTAYEYEEGFHEGIPSWALVSTTEIADVLQEHEDDDSIKAFILHIDSNGGDHIAQEELAKQIRKMKKPVVAVISNRALSSGYYVAAATDRIFASELSFVADIGSMVTALYIDENGLFQKCQISSSEFKRMWLNDYPGIDRITWEGGIIRADSGTRQVASDIAQFRNLSESHALKLADGGIFTGVGALKLGLIDEIGGIHEAVDWLETKLGAKLEIVYYSELEAND